MFCRTHTRPVARREINETLRLCNLCIRRIGLSFIDEDVSNTVYEKCLKYFSLLTCSSFLFLMLLGEYAYIVGQMSKSASIEDFIGSYLHIAGYDTLSKFVFTTAMLTCILVFIIQFF